MGDKLHYVAEVKKLIATQPKRIGKLESFEQELTSPFQRFLQEDIDLATFLRFIMSLARPAFTHDQMTAMLDKIKAGQIDREQIGRVLEAYAKGSTMLSYGGMIAQMQHGRMVDNFQSYISELLALIFRTKPETLRSDKMQISVREALEHATMEDLVDSVAEQRVNELTYKGLGDLVDYLARTIGFDLFPDKAIMAAAVRAVEQRNLIVHNRGIVNRIFVSRLPEYAAQLGQSLEFSIDETSYASILLRNATWDIDDRASEKFGLPRQKVKFDGRSTQADAALARANAALSTALSTDPKVSE